MTTPLLTTKLYIPPVRPDPSTGLTDPAGSTGRTSLVPRPRLIEQLNEGLRLGRKLTLISAPAGFGKTTLLSEWVHRTGADGGGAGGTGAVPSPLRSGVLTPTAPLRVGWLSLDAGDNDPTRFLAYLIAALQSVKEDIGETVLGVLRSPQPPPMEALLVALINQINATSDPIALVLDDYHLITTQPIHAALAFLLDHLPGNLHLIIATRSDPPLPLARLRGRGLLTELRATDLRFTRDEAAQFNKEVMGLELSEDDMSALTARTEGWIAGLQMAAISMKGRDTERIADFIQAFAGSNRYVMDYLVEEVLDQLPHGTQDFLLQTSILNRFSGPLCDAVLGITDETPAAAGQNETPDSFAKSGSPSQQVLEQLEASNLFIVPLDDERRWYRYHHLFADLLRNQLYKTQPGLRSTLHRRAGQWFEQEGLIPEAMHHAIATENFDRAATLLESIVSSLLNESRPATLLSLLAMLPDETIATRPWLCVHGAWSHFLTWQFDPIEPLLQSVESGLAVSATTEPPGTFARNARIRGRMVALRAFMAQWQGDLARASALSHKALEHLDEDDQQLRSVLETNLGDICLIEGDLASARQHLEKSITAGKAAGNFYAALSSVSRLAAIEAIQGRLHQSAKTYQEAIRLGTQWGGGKPMPGTGRAHVGLAQVLYEWNDLDETARHLTSGIHLGEQCGEQEIVLEGTLTLARLRQAQRKADAATEALEKAEAIVARDSRIPAASVISSWQTRILLAQGDLSGAIHWADSQQPALDVPDVSDFRFEGPRLTLVRVWIAQGKVEKAMRLLEKHLPAAEAGGRVGSAIEMLILRALALQAQGKATQAMTSLEGALSLAEPEGYARIFVDEGPAMARLLYDALSRRIEPDYTSRLLSAFPVAESEQTDRLKTRTPESDLVEPLSEREVEVLRLIAEGLSNREIARQLYISLATVKWHTSNIYGKMAVKNRTQAVAKARALGILPHPE